MLASDSAGGGLALAALIALRDEGTPLPAGAICLSPWVDRPGSGAPEIPYVEMVESTANQGCDLRKAETLLPEGIRLAAAQRMDDLRALTAELLALLHVGFAERAFETSQSTRVGEVSPTLVLC